MPDWAIALVWGLGSGSFVVLYLGLGHRLAQKHLAEMWTKARSTWKDNSDGTAHHYAQSGVKWTYIWTVLLWWFMIPVWFGLNKTITEGDPKVIEARRAVHEAERTAYIDRLERENKIGPYAEQPAPAVSERLLPRYTTSLSGFTSLTGFRRRRG